MTKINTEPALPAEIERALDGIDLAARNALLAFHDYPRYTGGIEERCAALDSLAEAVKTLRESRAALLRASPRADDPKTETRE